MFVMRKSLNHLAVSDPTICTLFEHSRDLGLERLEPLDATVDLNKMALCDRINLTTGPIRSV